MPSMSARTRTSIFDTRRFGSSSKSPSTKCCNSPYSGVPVSPGRTVWYWECSLSLIGIMREMVAYVRTAWRTSRKPPPRDALLANAPGEHSRRALPARGLHESAPQILGHFDPNANWANVLDKCPADSGARCAGLFWGTLRRTPLGSPALAWLTKASKLPHTADLCHGYASHREYTALWLSAAGAC